MSNMLATGASWLAEQLQGYAATAVTYHRGASSISLNATAGRTDRTGDEQAAIKHKFSERDWIIRVEDLAISGNAITPAMGDYILEAVGSATHRWNVVMQDGQPQWDYSDLSRVLLRVHTKWAATT